MNAASVKILSINEPAPILGLLTSVLTSWKEFLLVILVLCSALSVVYEKDLYRQLFA